MNDPTPEQIRRKAAADNGDSLATARTLREHLAGGVLQGLLAGQALSMNGPWETRPEWRAKIANEAVELADALLARLEEVPHGGR